MSETIQEALKTIATQWPDRSALQMYSPDKPLKTYSYIQVVERFKLAAKQLQELGILPGDRVILVAANSPEWVIAYLAILEASATPVPLDPSGPPADLETLIEISDPRAIICSHLVWEKLTPNATEKLLVLDIEKNFSPIPETPTRLSPDIPPTTDPNPEIAAIFFTSGTTGRPKGVLIDHLSLIYNARGCLHALGVKEGDEPLRVLSILPMSHVLGLVASLITPLLGGATTTFVETVDKQAILAAMQETRTTVLPGVPRLLELFYNQIRDRVGQKGLLVRAVFEGLGLVCETVRFLTPWNPGKFLFRSVHEVFGGSLRIFCSGGAPLSLEVDRGLERLGFTLIKGFGLSETGGIAICNSVREPRVGHVGKPVEGVEIRLDLTNASESEGEICLRGPNLMRGYFRDRQATSEAIRDGWLHTGDIGRFDDRGNLMVTGRMKDLIVTAVGKKAAPNVVEEYYRDIRGVKELAVVGIPAKQGSGEQIFAAAVPDPQMWNGSTGDRQLLQTIEMAINDRAAEVPSYLRIQGVCLVEQLPKTNTLKVKRSLVKQLLEAELAARELALTEENLHLDPIVDSEPADEITRQVMAIVKEIAGANSNSARTMTVRSTLQFDLAIDSLGWIELVAKLKAGLGIEIDPQLAPVFYTVGDLVAAAKTFRETANLGQLERAPSPVVAIQLEGQKTPLCCIHPMAGVVFPYYNFARLLGRERPFYALRSPGLQTGEEPLTTIEEMAACYMQAWREIQPEGPYFLAGWSLGGLIAFEMSRQLQENGQTVALLALIDTPAPSDSQVVNFWRMFQLLPATLRDVWSYVFEYFERLEPEKAAENNSPLWLKLVRTILSLRKSDKTDGEQSVSRLLRVIWNNVIAMKNYSPPQTYSGKIAVLATGDRHKQNHRELTSGWNRLTAGEVEVHDLRGNHMNIVKFPYVQTLAQKLEACLSDADELYTNSPELKDEKYPLFN